jgi:hypothetical protein
MAAEDLNLSGINNLGEVLARTRNGTAAVALVAKLGLWTESAHKKKNVRPEFPQKLSILEPAELSDLYSEWTAEFGRIVELCGAVIGQEALLKIQLKSGQAKARAKIRRNQKDTDKQLTASAINDMVDEEAAVCDLIEQHGLVVVLGAHCSAAKEATAQYLATISREISFRDAQMKAKLY